MYSMTIPKANLTPEAVQIIGDLAVYHRATVLGDDETTTIEFRTLRLNGVDVSGEARVPVQVVDLLPLATAMTPLPLWIETGEQIPGMEGLVSTTGSSFLYPLSVCDLPAAQSVISKHSLTDRSNLFNASQLTLHIPDGESI
jgi:hypothetical protein